MSAVVNVHGAEMRRMTYRDLSSVMRIENAAYEYPWSEGIFRDCLRVGYSCWVYIQGQEVQAYGVMSMAAGECHILNLCVWPGAQGKGLGRLMLRRLLRIARRHDVDTVILEVRPSNHRAVGLYRSEGFNELGVRKNYYPAVWGREDALLMGKGL